MGVDLGWRVEDAETPSLDLGRPSWAGQEGSWYRSQVALLKEGAARTRGWVCTFVGLLEPWM